VPAGSEGRSLSGVRQHVRLGLSLIGIVVAVTGCTTSTTTPSAGGVTRIAILHPADGDQIYGKEVSVLVHVSVGDPTSSDAVARVVYILDGHRIATSASPDRELRHLHYGEHVLRVELVGRDLRPLDPPVTARVTFETASLASDE